VLLHADKHLGQCTSKTWVQQVLSTEGPPMLKRNAQCGARTHDHQIKSLALYRLS
jgi:hypothetical protein